MKASKNALEAYRIPSAVFYARNLGAAFTSQFEPMRVGGQLRPQHRPGPFTRDVMIIQAGYIGC